MTFGLEPNWSKVCSYRTNKREVRHYPDILDSRLPRDPPRLRARNPGGDAASQRTHDVKFLMVFGLLLFYSCFMLWFALLDLVSFISDFSTPKLYAFAKMLIRCVEGISFSNGKKQGLIFRKHMLRENCGTSYFSFILIWQRKKRTGRERLASCYVRQKHQKIN
jgi:hypothetical protein